MTRALRNGLRILATLALLAAGAAFLLSAVLRSEAARVRVEAAARSALGAPVRFRGVSTELAPPALLLRHVSVSDPADPTDDGPPLEAARVRLSLAPLPLLIGRLEVRDLRIDQGRAVLHWSRPGAAALLLRPPEAGPRAASGRPASRAPGVRRLSLHDCELVLVDDRLAPPPALAIEGLHGMVTLEAGGSRIRLAGRVPAGGRVAAEGTLASDGALHLLARLDDVPLAPFAPWFGGGVGPLPGTASGTLSIARQAGEPQAAVQADLVAAPVALALGSALLRGPVSLRGQLVLGAAETTGRFELDVTEAELLGPGAFRKPPGRLASADGLLRPRPDGTLGVDALRLRLKGVALEGAVRGGATPAAAEGER